jgi:hypothetical protein
MSNAQVPWWTCFWMITSIQIYWAMTYIAGTRSPVHRLHQPPRTYLSCTSEHGTTNAFPILGYIFQDPIPTSSETFDLMIDAAANRCLQVEMEVSPIRTQLHELYGTAVDLAPSTEMS